MYIMLRNFQKMLKYAKGESAPIFRETKFFCCFPLPTPNPFLPADIPAEEGWFNVWIRVVVYELNMYNNYRR